MTLKLGIALMGQQPIDSHQHEHYRELLEQAMTAEKQGFDSAWIGEHHASEDCAYFQTIPTLTAIASNTKRLKVAPQALPIPIYNPLFLAEQLAMLDVISNGRVILGASSGYRKQEFSYFGASFDQRESIFEEALSVMKDLWTKPKVRRGGNHFRFYGLQMNPKPVQKTGPPVWVCGFSESMIKMAARIGDVWLPYSPSSSMKELKEKFRLHREELSKLKRSPPEIVPLIRDGYAAESTDRAIREHRNYFMKKYRETYSSWGVSKETIGFELSTFKYEDALKNIVVGDADTCIEKLDRYRKELGVNYIILRLQVPGIRHRQVLEAVGILGKRVLPYFSES